MVTVSVDKLVLFAMTLNHSKCPTFGGGHPREDYSRSYAHDERESNQPLPLLQPYHFPSCQFNGKKRTLRLNKTIMDRIFAQGKSFSEFHKKKVENRIGEILR